MQSNRRRLKADGVEMTPAEIAISTNEETIKMKLEDYGQIFILYAVVLLAMSISFPAEVCFKRRKKGGTSK